MSITDKIKAYSTLLKGKIEPDYNLKNVFEINIEELKEIFNGKNVILIAPGHSIYTEHNKVLSLIENNYPGKIKKTYNALTSGTDVTDGSGHGTHIAGTIAEYHFGIPEDLKNKGLKYLTPDLLQIYNDYCNKYGFKI